MTQKVRVRFAPSPTGPLHIGGVRTALFNYLFAKKHGGDFILRIEDTDQKRYVEGAEDYIINALNWCGIPFDEGIGKEKEFGPYRQSERKAIYKQYAQELLDSGNAYYAFDTAESLDALRTEKESNKQTFIYNWSTRDSLENSLTLSKQEVAQKLANNTPYVIRFKAPQAQELVMQDLIRGEIKINTDVLDDKILFKSDGMPTYHLANIVDDHLMQISHVIRGEEWLPSMALHVLLYRALGWESPAFAHLPLILKPTGKGKLSKRDGDKLGFPVFPLQWTDPKTQEVSRGYKEDGYFSAATINFLALLGWNAGNDQELFSMEELIENFSLERVQKAGARFDPDKIKWFNHQYMQNEHEAVLAQEFKNMQPELATIDPGYIALVIEKVKERATFIADFWQLSSYFFVAPTSYDAKASKKAFKEETPTLLQEVISMLEAVDAADFTPDLVQEKVKGWITQNNIGFGKVMQPLRLALVGALQGPDVFDIMYLIGKNESIARIQHLITHIKS